MIKALIGTLSKSGPCFDSWRFVKMLQKNSLLRTLCLVLFRFRFSPEVLQNIRNAEDLDTAEAGKVFSSAISYVFADGTYKTTSAKRTSLADAEVRQCLSEIDSPSLMEVGVSDGSSSLELLRDSSRVDSIRLTDKHPCFYSRRMKWGRIYYDSNLRRMGFKICGFYLAVSSSERFKGELDPIETISPLVVGVTNSSTIEQFDVFTGRLSEPVSVIKCANVLNLAYFSKQAILEAVRNLEKNIVEDGFLVISHNNERYTEGEAVVVLQKIKGQLQVVKEYGRHESLGLLTSMLVRPEVGKRKVCLLIPSLEPGGAERQAVLLANGLAKDGWEVALGVFRGKGALESLLAPQVNYFDLKKRGRWDLLGFFWRLIKLVRSERPAVLHPFMGTACVVSIFLKPFVKAAKIVWSVRASDVDYSSYGLVSQAAYLLECWLSRYADEIIVNSQAGRVFSEQNGFPQGGLTVVPNGIDVESFRFSADGRDRVRKELGIPMDDQVVGMVARLDVMKDHRTFLKAAERVCAVKAGVRFVCVGTGPLKAELERLSVERGLPFVWGGPRNDMVDVYSSFDVCCLSSAFGEGFPNVLGEAMSCGVPCVSTDVGDARLVVGKAGRIVPRGDFELLADALLSTLDSVGKGGSELARSRVECEYSIEQLVQRTQRVFLGSNER